jgi:hypothetical protein
MQQVVAIARDCHGPRMRATQVIVELIIIPSIVIARLAHLRQGFGGRAVTHLPAVASA